MTVEEKTLSVSPESERAIRSLAERVERPVDEILTAAIDRYVADEELHLARIKDAVARADAGDALVPFEEALEGWRETVEATALRRT
ncbi:hypothetical protein [Methylopila sp. M107]|uniref:hypothetical protein n=1 Tax=Methylopila sp. M107 TaxID=1101190 RepID=UPI000374D280|nr:hypothetical protein [Methylopila sp. M107]